MKTLALLLLFPLIFPLLASAQSYGPFLDSPDAYLGLTPPGDTPIPFAPGRFNDPGTILMDRIAISVDGKMICVEQNKVWYSLVDAKLKCLTFDGQKWVGPTVFGDHFFAPTFNADGNSLLLHDDRANIVLRSTKTNGTWSTPAVYLEGDHELYDLILTNSGTYYAGSTPSAEDLKEGITFSFTTVTGSGKNLHYKSLGRPLNEPGFNGDFYVAADESYMIVSAKETQSGECELFISFRKTDGTWTNPKSLGSKVNKKVAHRWGQFVSPDGKYLFYSYGTSAKDCVIVWVRFDELLEQARRSNFEPYVARPIADQSATSHSPFSLIVPADTFVDDDGTDTLTIRATSANNVPLPSWLKFDPHTKTLSGTPPEPSTYLITITATDPAHAFAASTFSLTVH